MKPKLILLMLCLPLMLTAQQKVAVYVTSDAEGVDDNTKEIIGGELVAAIVNTNKYKAVERTADFLQQISKEQGYQHSGNVDIDQISAIGKQLGVNYVCVASIMTYRNTYYIQARMIDVETAIVQNTARETSTLANIDEIILAASKVAHTLINPDSEYVAPVTASSDKKSSRNKDSYVPMANTEGQIIRYNATERHALDCAEYAYGETPMDRKAFAKFLAKNCPEARIQYFKGQQCITAGWCLLGIGAGILATGLYFGLTYSDYRDALGWYSVGIGGVALVSSFVLLPVGYSKRDNAYKVYNEKYAYKRTASCTLNLQSSSDGLGIALRF